MRYSSNHKQETRERIIETAARSFREKGFDGTGVQALMADAGLTNGAFYNHFESKEDLIAEAIAAGLSQRLKAVQEHIDAGRGVEGHIDSYLSMSHRDNPGMGCPTATLAAEVARHSDEVRQSFTDGLAQYLELLATQWPDLSHEAAIDRAIVLYSLMSGTMQLARATPDDALSRRILDTGKKAAMAMLTVVQSVKRK